MNAELGAGTDLTPDNVPQAIERMKRALGARRDLLDRAYREVTDQILFEADSIAAQRDSGKRVIPELDLAAIEADRVAETLRTQIRRRGVCVIRNVVPREEAKCWNDELGEYISGNGYYTARKDPNLDKYFTTLDAARPQIFGIYWSRPQIQARQHPSLAAARRFLNRLWRSENEGGRHFDPDREASYADRTRRRESGDRTLGLSPHMDAGSVERWLDPAYGQVYRHVFSGDWQRYEAFDGAWRTRTREIPSPAVCSMFRSFQGWTALTTQGPHDGTLQVVPIANGIVYMLLRALQADVPEAELCDAMPGRALSASAQWHPALLPALTSIPLVEPGDTVWWHPDIIHAVENEHAGKNYSNVIYVAAAPWCEKNAAYLERQKPAFLEGRSAPDFAPEDFEIDYKNRATLDDLSPLGRRQMGFEPW